MKHCKDCEPVQQSHFVAYMTVLTGWLNQPFFDFVDRYFRNWACYLADKTALPFFNTMVFLGIAKYDYELKGNNSLRAKAVWEEAKKRGIAIKEFRMGPIGNLFVASHGGRTITFDCLPGVYENDNNSLEWMDDKGIMKKKFKKEGLPVADGGVAWYKGQALKIFDRIQKPVITKPNLGSRSRHTKIHINTKEELLNGFKIANQLSPFVIVEEELRGDLYRGTVVNNEFVACVRRDAPQVLGDGVRTVRELMEEENNRPERQGPVFHKITYDKEAEIELARQGLSLESISPVGKKISFSQKTSRSCGGTTTEVTDKIHLENKKMLEHVAKFLDTRIVGIDFIMEDIEKPWSEQKNSGIIECNSLPFIDLHHYVLFGTPVNVASKLWDMAMPETKSKNN